MQGLPRFRAWPAVMNNGDPRSAQLYRERMHQEADRDLARQALDQREIMAGADDAALKGALTELYRAARAARQEGGANTLFLTVGSLYYNQRDKERRCRAPILLVPVTLERPNVRSGFYLRALDEETRVNPTLLEMLRQEHGMRIPALEGDRIPNERTAGEHIAGDRMSGDDVPDIRPFSMRSAPASATCRAGR